MSTVRIIVLAVIAVGAFFGARHVARTYLVPDYSNTSAASSKAPAGVPILPAARDYAQKESQREMTEGGSALATGIGIVAGGLAVFVASRVWSA